MKYASFFSGIGGFELALDAAGLERVFSCEIDPFCNEVFKARWGHECEARDITKLRPEEIPDADLWVGGFPCQDLSIAGRRGGIQANRSGLVWRFLELAKVRRPHTIWLENVPGLLSSENGRDFALLLREMEKLGYSCEWRVLDAQHQGVPQRRRRVFIVGHLGAECFPEILLEPQGRSGNPPKGRQKGKIASGEIARSVGGVSGGDDIGANKGTLVHSGETQTQGNEPDDPVVGDKAPAVDGNMNRTGNERTEAEKLIIEERPILNQAITSKMAKGSSGPAGDEHHNLIVMRIGQGSADPLMKKKGIVGNIDCGSGHEDGGSCYYVAKPKPAEPEDEHPDGDLVIGISNQPTPKLGKNVMPTLDAKGGKGGGPRGGSMEVVFIHQHDEGANQNHVKTDGKSDALDTTGPGAVAFAERTREGEKNLEVTSGGVAPALTNPEEVVAIRVTGDYADPTVKVDDKVQVDANPMSDRVPLVAFTQNSRSEVRELGDKTGCVAAQAGAQQQNYVAFDAHNKPKDKTGTLCGGEKGGGKNEINLPVVAINTELGLAPHGSLRGSEVTPSVEASEGKRKTVVAFQSTGGSRDVQAGEKSPPLKVGTGLDIPSPPAIIRYRDTRKNPTIKGDKAETLDTGSGCGGGAANQAVAFEQRVARNGRGKPSPVVPPLKAESGQTGKGDGAPSVLSPSLRGYGHGAQGQHNDDASRMMLIRRLTPTECERLQGFPDGHTCLCGVRSDCPDRRIAPWIDPKIVKLGGCGHSACGCKCSDSARYRALGNAVAVPVIRWIAERMRKVLGV